MFKNLSDFVNSLTTDEVVYLLYKKYPKNLQHQHTSINVKNIKNAQKT